jgi:hypothetical protein
MAATDEIIHVGEVIQASSISLTAVCTVDTDLSASFPDPPSLGAFVRIPVGSTNASEPEPLSESAEDIDPFLSTSPRLSLPPDAIFGIVSYVQTSSIDPGRRPSPLGISTADELLRIQPQIFELLTVEMTIALTSYTDSDAKLLHRIPPKPPHIHSFVYACPQSQVAALTEDLGFLRTVLGNGGQTGSASSDDIAAAVLYSGWLARNFDENYIVAAGKAILRMLSNDYERFKSIIQRIS